MKSTITNRNARIDNLNIFFMLLNPLGANPRKWSSTLKQFVGKLPTNRLSVFDHFVGLTLKGLISSMLLVSLIFSDIIERDQWYEMD